MFPHILKFILVASIILQTGCDITFKRTSNIDNDLKIKQEKNKKIVSKIMESIDHFSKNDSHIIRSYYSNKENSTIRKDMIMHTKISKKEESKLKVGKVIPRNVQVIPLPLKLERNLSSLPLQLIRVQVGVRVVLMNVKSRQILDMIKI